MALTQEQVDWWFSQNPTATADDVAAAVKGAGGLDANAGLADMIANRYQIEPTQVTDYYNQYVTPPAAVEQPVTKAPEVDYYAQQFAPDAYTPTTNEELLAIVGPPAVVEQPAQTPTNTVKYHDGTTYDATQLETLTKQITDLSSTLGTDKFWTGGAYTAGEGANIGFDADTAAQILGTDTVTNKQQVALDMAANLRNAGVTSLDQIGMGDIQGDVSVIEARDENGNPTGTYLKLDTETGQYVPADATDIRTITVGDGENQSQQLVTTGVVGTGIINKDTGQAIGDGSGDIGYTATGSGGTEYKLKIDPATGAPIFYTVGVSSNDLAQIMEGLGPIGNIGLAIATGGLSIPQQIAANMALQALSGKDMDDVIKNAVVSFAGSQIPGMDFMKDGASFIKDLGLPKELTDTLTRGLQNAVTSTATAALSGKDDLGSAFVKGFTTGGTGAAVNALLGNIEGFGDLTADQKKMVVNAVTGVVSGKPLEQVVINSAISAANSAIAQAKGASTTPTGNTEPAITTLSAEDLAELKLRNQPGELQAYQDGGVQGLANFRRDMRLLNSLTTSGRTGDDMGGNTIDDVIKDSTTPTTEATTPADTSGTTGADTTDLGSLLDEVTATGPNTDSGLSNQDLLDLTNITDDTVVVKGDKPLDYLPTDDDFVPTKIDDKGEVVITGGRPTGTTSTDTTGLDEGPIIPTGGDGLETVTVTGGTGNDTITGGTDTDTTGLDEGPVIPTGDTVKDEGEVVVTGKRDPCPPGTHYDETLDACVPDDTGDDDVEELVVTDKKCDPGYVYDEALKQCVPIVTTPVVKPPVVVQPPVVKPPVVKQPVVMPTYVPSGYYGASDKNEPVYAGAMDDFNLFATLQELLAEEPAKKDNKKSKDKTKMATGGHLDDLLAEQMTVDDLLKLLR